MSTYKIAIADNNKYYLSGLKEALSGYKKLKISLYSSFRKNFMLSKYFKDPHHIMVITSETIKQNEPGFYLFLKKRVNNKPAILVVLNETDRERISKLIINGVNGFIDYNSDAGYILNALEHIIQKGYFVNDLFANNNNGSKRIGEISKSPLKQTRQNIKLTKRQREILQLMIRGLTAKQIADKLYISSRTVEKHKEEMYRKTLTHKDCHLIAVCYEHGIISKSDTS